MITTQRVILYRIDDDPDVFKFEIVNSYEFNKTPMTIDPIGLFFFWFLKNFKIFLFLIEDDDNCAYIQILLNSKNSIHRCDTLEQATLFSREVQRAQDIFKEEKLIYIPSDDENEDFDE